MRIPRSALCALVLSLPAAAIAQRITPVPLIGEPTVAALDNELSGAAAKRTVEFLAQLNRPRGSRTFSPLAAPGRTRSSPSPSPTRPRAR